MLFVASGGAGVQGGAPSGSPSSLTTSTTGASTVRLHWVNGDPAGYTRIYRLMGGCGETPVLYTTVNPGETAYDTGFPVGGTGQAVISGWKVSHYKNGQESGFSNCVETVQGDQF
jgi:hypothetical protein